MLFADELASLDTRASAVTMMTNFGFAIFGLTERHFMDWQMHINKFTELQTL